MENEVSVRKYSLFTNNTFVNKLHYNISKTRLVEHRLCLNKKNRACK